MKRNEYIADINPINSAFTAECLNSFIFVHSPWHSKGLRVLPVDNYLFLGRRHLYVIIIQAKGRWKHYPQNDIVGLANNGL